MKLYAGAKALIFCALDEDFGMVPVEAMAHGTPVVRLRREWWGGGRWQDQVFDEPTVEVWSGDKKLGRLGSGEMGRRGESMYNRRRNLEKAVQKELTALSRKSGIIAS